MIGDSDTSEDATQVGNERLVDLFRAESITASSCTLSDFLNRYPEARHRDFLVALVLADIEIREKKQEDLSPREYFDAFPELYSLADASQILTAREDWFIEHEGPNWTESWAHQFPELTNRSASNVPLVASTPIQDIDLDDLQPGDELLDFEIEQFVGKGTFGRVYLANDKTLNRQCALKVTEDQGSEGQLLARLNHPGVINVYQEHRIHGKKLLSMRFIAGDSLAEWIASHAPSSADYERFSETQRSNHLKRGVELIRDVARALQHAHVHGVLHRDIKPANILLDEKSNPILSDFNVAIATQGSSRLVGGTINYMSPEQLESLCFDQPMEEQRVDTRSDIYSLGVVLLEVLTGEKTWTTITGNDQRAAANQLLASRIRSGPPKIAITSGVTPALAAIVNKALDPKPSARYQSAAELETDLSDWLSDRNNTYANNPNMIERSRRHVKAHKQRWIGIGTVAATLVLAFISAWALSGRYLASCQSLARECEQLVLSDQISLASEKLGEAKSLFRQVRLARWVMPSSYLQTEQRLVNQSNLISQKEAQKFSSQFGEIVLRDIHQQEGEQQAALIKKTLDVYQVMTFPDWQHRSPFKDLPPAKQAAVAESITELILVSMFQSAKQQAPEKEKLELVISRVPEEHRNLQIFDRIRSEGLDASLHSRGTSNSFETYLYGVLASLSQEYESAVDLFKDSLRSSPEARFWCSYRLAYTCQKLGRYDEAFIHYGVCIGLQPKFAWPVFNLGLVCSKTGRPDLGELHIQQAIETDQAFTAAYVALMAVQIQQKKFDCAISTYEKAKKKGVLSPELESHMQLAMKERTRSNAD